MEGDLGKKHGWDPWGGKLLFLLEYRIYSEVHRCRIWPSLHGLYCQTAYNGVGGWGYFTWRNRLQKYAWHGKLPKKQKRHPVHASVRSKHWAGKPRMLAGPQPLLSIILICNCPQTPITRVTVATCNTKKKTQQSSGELRHYTTTTEYTEAKTRHLD